MKNAEKNSSQNEMWNSLAQRLESVKGSRENRTLDLIIKDIKLGRIDSAKTECFNNGDKIATWFPEAVTLLADELFMKGEKNPFRFTLPSEDEELD